MRPIFLTPPGFSLTKKINFNSSMYQSQSLSESLLFEGRKKKNTKFKEIFHEVSSWIIVVSSIGSLVTGLMSLPKKTPVQKQGESIENKLKDLKHQAILKPAERNITQVNNIISFTGSCFYDLWSTFEKSLKSSMPENKAFNCAVNRLSESLNAQDQATIEKLLDSAKEIKVFKDIPGFMDQFIDENILDPDLKDFAKLKPAADILKEASHKFFNQLVLDHQKYVKDRSLSIYLIMSGMISFGIAVILAKKGILKLSPDLLLPLTCDFK